MPSVRFRQEREATWRELESLLARAERSGLRRLSPDEVARLPLLHRAALSSLGVARAIALDAALLEYLESLATRSHVVLHGGREPLGESLRRFWGRTFPREVRALRWHALAAAMLMAAGVATAWREVSRDPARFGDFVSASYAAGRGPESSTDELRAVLGARDTPRAELVRFSSLLFTNNASIGLLSLGVGLAAGVPVAYLLLANGTILGAFAWLYGSRGLGWEFAGWVLPHGVTELSALVLCAAGGLRLGLALLFPGRRSRADSLRLGGATAGAVAVGALAMFLVAGIIEGVFRQTVASPGARWTVAVGSLLGWTVYFARAGRRA